MNHTKTHAKPHKAANKKNKTVHKQQKRSNATLTTLRNRHTGKIATTGLTDSQIAKFGNDENLKLALSDAQSLIDSGALPPISDASEIQRGKDLQKDLLQFYDPTTVNPYIPIAARGPFIITDAGAVVYDAGGYGMLGFGHAPQMLLDEIAKPHVQANIMTPSHYQARFTKNMKKEIGNTRSGKNRDPYADFVIINSGSESVSFAMRVADVDAKVKTAPGGPAAGKQTCIVSLDTSFHGRTERPAHASDSSRPAYKKHLKSFENVQVPLYTLPVNDVGALEETFKKIEADGFHPEIMLMEATQGEGNPGVRLTREFYDKARSLTKKSHSLLLIDSIQAGFRATGELSIMDYPGFADADAPDFETFSKALNGGQFPMSAVAFAPGVSEIYKKGLYGNTMTGNPRGLAVASTVLENMTPEIKQNIAHQGEAMLAAFQKIQKDYPGMVAGSSGSGLLNALRLKTHITAYGDIQSVEAMARRQGLGVIHGGGNSLRYTPWFKTSAAEVELIADLTRSALETYAEHNKISTKTE